MKCIRCGTENTLRDRTDQRGRCKSCGHTFVFEPTAMSTPLRFTDGFFAKLIQDVSHNGTLFFTEKQLFYLFNRRLEQKALNTLNGTQGLGCVLIFVGVPLLAIGLGLILLPVGVALILWGWRQKRQQAQKPRATFQADLGQFRNWYLQWQRVNGIPEKILPPLSPSADPVEVSPDLQSYSFDRVVVCESDAIARLLIANNLHFEHNCAVVSLNGFPQGIFPTLMTMLQRNPALTVYALHDATPAGLRLMEHLRQPNWFPDPQIALYDLGLLPRHAIALKTAFVRTSAAAAQQARRLPDPVRQNLTTAELAWLEAGSFLELEAFGPQKLLQVVSQGISRSRLPASADGPFSTWDDPYHGSSLIFVSDGFG